jgi:methanogenic corrinoid protein MtbC1
VLAIIAISDSVVDMEEEKTIEITKQFIENGFDTYEGID